MNSRQKVEQLFINNYLTRRSDFNENNLIIIFFSIKYRFFVFSLFGPFFLSFYIIFIKILHIL